MRKIKTLRKAWEKYILNFETRLRKTLTKVVKPYSDVYWYNQMDGVNRLYISLYLTIFLIPKFFVLIEMVYVW